MVIFKSVLLVILVVVASAVTEKRDCKESLRAVKVAAEIAIGHISDGKELDLLVDTLKEFGIKVRDHEDGCPETYHDILAQVKPMLPKHCSKKGVQYFNNVFYELVEDPAKAPRGKPAYHVNRVTVYELRHHCTKDEKKKEKFHHTDINVKADPTFDFVAPFKDYNNKIQLTVQGIQSGSKLIVVSNFHPNMGWGECFGQGMYNLNISTTQKGNLYETTIVNNDSAKKFDMTKFCDIMGTNSGDAVVLPGVAVPIVSSVNVDGATLKIAQSSQKDPGNGFKIGGYYAQWAVWGRQFNPYNIPFDSVNQLFYAFIGFNPGDGSIKTLDSAADGWGMSAISHALLTHPYLEAHLSFGGWTNNGQTTAPMFEQLASSQSSMDKFSTEAVALMRKLGFTGIDIDWEWWSDFDMKVAPAKKMLALFATVKKHLADASKADGKTYRLSAAVNGGSDRVLAMQASTNPNSVADFWKQVGGVVDQLNIMSYDYHGGFDVGAPAYFQSAYDFSNIGSNKVGKDEGWSIKSSVETYISHGIQAKQLVVGIPLYVRTMQVSSGTDGGLFAKVVGTGFGDYEKGILDYKCLVNPVYNPADGCGSSTPISGVKSLKYYNSNNNTDLFNLYGKDAYQPWAYSAETTTFATYDDVWSTTQKVNMVRARSLKGVMFWELDGDALAVDLSLIHTARKSLASQPLKKHKKYHKDSKNKHEAETKEEFMKMVEDPLNDEYYKKQNQTMQIKTDIERIAAGEE